MKEPTTKKLTKTSKEVINIIRTTQRNNIELTAIADNKANVLLSLNAIMIAAIIPMVIANTEMVFDRFLYVPLLIFATTCFGTIYICTQVLKPSRFEEFRDDDDTDGEFSPFFFGNFYDMKPNEYFSYMNRSLADSEMVKRHLAKDLFYVGRRLGKKMKKMRLAFNIFLTGVFLTLIAVIAVILI
ncbi:MAG: hypothetical protein ACI9XO_003088 [Paraglaciecola sp.]|jgi:hypothetical protein